MYRVYTIDISFWYVQTDILDTRCMTYRSSRYPWSVRTCMTCDMSYHHPLYIWYKNDIRILKLKFGKVRPSKSSSLVNSPDNDSKPLYRVHYYWMDNTSEHVAKKKFPFTWNPSLGYIFISQKAWHDSLAAIRTVSGVFLTSGHWLSRSLSTSFKHKCDVNEKIRISNS